LAVEQALSSGTSKNVGAFVQAATGSLSGVNYDVAKVKGRVEAKLAQLGLQADLAFLDAVTPAKVPPQNLDAFITQMPQLQDAQVLSQLSRALGVASPSITVDVKALLTQPEQQQALQTSMTTGAIDPSQRAELEAFFVDAGAKGLTALEVRQYLVALGQNPQQRLQQLAQARQLTAPVVRADATVIATRLDPILKASHLTRNASVDAFVKSVCASRTHAEAVAFVNQVAQNPEVALQTEAKRLGVPAPTPDRDWTTVDTGLKAQLAAQSVAWTPALEKLVRTVVTAGVPVASLTRAFQQLGAQPLEQALKTAGIFLVGATVPSIEADTAGIEQRLRQALTAYTPVVPQAGLDRFIASLVKAGMTPAQAFNYANVAYQNGKVSAAGQAGTVPLSAIPDLPVDVDAFAKATAQRLGAGYLPAHDAFIRQHLEVALNKGIGLRHFHNQAARTICHHIAGAASQQLPAGL
jgi:hypothetical protein